MTRIGISEGRLKLEILGWDKLWSFQNRLEFPMDHVVGARRWDQTRDDGWRGFRAPGTNIPGIIVAGTYRRKGERVFYDVHDFKEALVIELRDEKFHRLVVEVVEPEEVLRLLPDA